MLTGHTGTLVSVRILHPCHLALIVLIWDQRHLPIFNKFKTHLGNVMDNYSFSKMSLWQFFLSMASSKLFIWIESGDLFILTTMHATSTNTIGPCGFFSAGSTVVSIEVYLNTGDHSAKNRRNFPSHKHKCKTVRTVLWLGKTSGFWNCDPPYFLPIPFLTSTAWKS